jgi:uncharacterized iron-regulated membrane protein
VSKRENTKGLVRSVRQFRVYHKYIGLALAIILVVSAITGLLLGWKKDAAWIQPPSQKGASAELVDWMPVDQLAKLAREALYAEYPKQSGNEIDRLDVRPSKGIAKVLFTEGYWEVQIDGTTGSILSIDKRYSDFIEQIHDGSIISDPFKLVSMNVLGIGLSIMIITGTWLWYGPKRIRARKQKSKRSAGEKAASVPE